MKKLLLLFKRKGIIFSGQRYGIDALSAMAQGLFASLLVGTILSTIGTQFNLQILSEIGAFASAIKGPAMAVAIGTALKAPPYVLYSLVTVGFAADQLGGAGGPLVVYLMAIIACEIGKLVSKSTKLDLIVTPTVTILTGVLLSIWLAPTIGAFALSIGELVMWATNLQPFIMGIVIAVIMGVALTLPISSAAICAALNLTGLAGGAALIGCCTQMVGFACMSFKENKWSGLISQGIGTSMLQMGNIIRKPMIWLPTIVASAILGPIGTVIFKFEMNGPAIASGMGTSGLVGPIGVYTGWLNAVQTGEKASIQLSDWLVLLLLCVVLPAIVTYIIHRICLAKKLYETKHLKLEA